MKARDKRLRTMSVEGGHDGNQAVRVVDGYNRDQESLLIRDVASSQQNPEPHATHKQTKEQKASDVSKGVEYTIGNREVPAFVVLLEEIQEHARDHLGRPKQASIEEKEAV